MQRKLRVMRVSYPDIRVPQWQGRRLRGFFAAGQAEGSLLHNHGEGGRELYRYPLVQYKVLRQVPTILAIEQGIPAVHPLVMEATALRLGEIDYPCGQVNIDLRTDTAGDCPQPVRYRFLSPWFALSQENYRAYLALPPEEQPLLLQRILTGNILSMAKGLGLTVENRLQVTASLTPRASRFKTETVMGFVGEFSVNYRIPPLFALGKSISRGFGVVRPVDSALPQK